MNSDLFDISKDVIAHADIVEVASRYLKLERKGRNYTALCPFHDDKSMGSFYLSKEKQVFKCFSCNTAGNVINFVEKIENISYRDAVYKTAELIGYEDPRLKAQPRKQIDPYLQSLFNCLKDINQFYESSLTLSSDGAEALEYLHSRGLDDEIIKNFQIGYAQKNGKNIIEFLKNKGYSYQMIADTGIMSLNVTPYKDINTNRISFPIADRDGNIVGFSCRKFAKEDESKSKYINTSTTKLFNKSKVLYNFHKAAQEARKCKHLYVLEGFMDVIAAYRVGIKSAVGLMGVALTKENLQVLRSLNVEIRICLDLDGPGQENAYSIAQIFENEKIKYKLVSNDVNFPEKDSDEILKNHGEAGLREYLSTLIDLGDYLINYCKKFENLSSLSGKKSLLEKVKPYLASCKDELVYDYYLNKISDLTDFSKDLIDKQVRELKGEKQETIEENPVEFQIRTQKKDKDLTRLQLAERQVMRYILEDKEAFDVYKEYLGYFINPQYKIIANLIEEYIDSLESDDEYSVSNIETYISSSSLEEHKAKALVDEITTMVLEDYKIPPYSKDIMTSLIETISQEKTSELMKDTFVSSTKNKSNEEVLEYAKLYLLKRKELLEKQDKKRRK